MTFESWLRRRCGLNGLLTACCQLEPVLADLADLEKVPPDPEKVGTPPRPPRSPSRERGFTNPVVLVRVP